MRIGSWNITSWNKREQEVIIEVNKHRIDICALSELKKKGKGNSKYQNYILFYSGKEKNERASAGVGILVHEKFENHIEEVQYINSNMMYITLKFGKERINFISIYAPDMTKPKEERATFFEELQEVIEKSPKKSKTFIVGDFNSRIGNTPIPGIMQRFNEGTINNNGEMLISICAQNELRINNTFYEHKEQHKLTFGNTRGSNSTIDYIITNREIQPNQILDIRTLTSANAGTEHGLVLGTYRFRPNLQRKKPPMYITKFNIESLKEESTKTLYQNRLKDKLFLNPPRKDDNPDVVWNKIKTSIIESAKEALGTRRTNTNGRKNNKPWFTKEVKSLTQQKKEAYLKYKNIRTQEEYATYKVVRNRVNEAIKNIKEIYWERFSIEMENDLYGGQKRVWKVLRNRKKEVNEEVAINSITPDKWKEYMQNLYNNQEYEDAAQVDLDRGAQMIAEENIKLEDVCEILPKLKNRKAPGPDDVSNEMLKYGGPELAKSLTELFRKILLSGSIPDEWRKSLTIPIFKKGNKNDPNNYRTITLLNSACKLFTKIMTLKLNNQIGISEEQHGFRRNRSTIDAIFIVRQVIEKSIEYNKPLFVCLVDLKKAFDRVRLNDVLQILQENDINNNYVKVIEELNKGNKTQLKTQHGVSEEMPIMTGIRQGDSMSPFLFSLIMDKIIQSVKEVNGGYRMGRKSLKISCFADDALLLAENEDELQRLLYRFQTTANTLNMEISTDKTEAMVISKDPVRCKLVVNDHPIKQKMNCRYLGVDVSSCKNLHQEVRAQVNKASRISGYLRDIIWKNRYMSTDSKVRIYRTVIRPVLTYASETRAETSKTKSMLRATEMKTLRAIKGVTLRDEIRSSTIREELKMTDVVRFVRSRRRHWRDHVDRMDDDRWAKWAKNEIPDTKRPTGRPPKRWHESWTSASQEA